jgi:hypothetical protein
MSVYHAAVLPLPSASALADDADRRPSSMVHHRSAIASDYSASHQTLVPLVRPPSSILSSLGRSGVATYSRPLARETARLGCGRHADALRGAWMDALGPPCRQAVHHRPIARWSAKYQTDAFSVSASSIVVMSDPLDPTGGAAGGADIAASYAAVPPPGQQSTGPAAASSSYPTAEEAYAMMMASSGAPPAEAAAAPAAYEAPPPAFPLYQPVSYAGRPDGRTCDQCGLPGHIAKFCPETMVCRKCGGAGHEQRACPDLHRVRMEENETDTIYIQGLPTNITEDDLVAFFGSIGLVRMQAGKGKDRFTKKPKVWIYRDKSTGQPKGDATFSYEDPPSAPAAVKWSDASSHAAADAWSATQRNSRAHGTNLSCYLSVSV